MLKSLITSGGFRLSRRVHVAQKGIASGTTETITRQRPLCDVLPIIFKHVFLLREEVHNVGLPHTNMYQLNVRAQSYRTLPRAQMAGHGACVLEQDT